jgi:hypothetical protein
LADSPVTLGDGQGVTLARLGKAALVILDNGQGATFVLATCDTEREAEAKAKRLLAELTTTDFDEWSRLHDVPSGFLDRPRDRGEFQRLIAGFWPFRLRDYILTDGWSSRTTDLSGSAGDQRK